MRVAIAGGHGQIALLLAARLAEHGDEAVSLVRSAGHFEDVEAAGGTPVLCDLEAASAEELAAAIEGADAVVFAAGAGPGSGPERKETVDYGGAVKLIAAARASGVSRYVMVSAMRAAPDFPGEDTFSVYLRAKGRADAELAASGLDFTIVKPGLLTDDPGTGLVSAGPDVGRAEVSREDVAAVLEAVLHEPATIGAAFEVVGGETPVGEAVRQVAGQSR